jgi:hypothetical protein
MSIVQLFKLVRTEGRNAGRAIPKAFSFEAATRWTRDDEEIKNQNVNIKITM